MTIKEKLEDLMTEVLLDSDGKKLTAFHFTFSCILYSAIIDCTEEGSKRNSLLSKIEDAGQLIRQVLATKHNELKENKTVIKEIN